MYLVDWAVLAADGETPDPGTGEMAGGGLGNLLLPVMLVGLVVLFWFMSRRNKKQQGKVEDFRNTLDIGTRVMTVGGMIGVITHLQGDVVTIKSASGDETQYTRRAIREAVTDDMWDAMLRPTFSEEEPIDELEGADQDFPDEPDPDEPGDGEAEDTSK